MTAPRLDTRGVHDLLRAATERVPLIASDGKSGATLERIVVDGRSYVLKRTSWRGDWVAFVAGDRVGWVRVAWEAGLVDRLPPSFDHAIVGVARDPTGDDVLVLMEDVAELLVPEGDEPVSLAQHGRFIEHLAAFHAAFWGWRDEIGLCPPSRRWQLLGPDATRRALADLACPPVVSLIVESWARVADRSPRLETVVRPLLRDQSALLRALADTPTTFVHGDWKMGNLGSRPDGRTILLDWSIPGEAPPLADLAHYLAINAARLPEPKEQAIDRYRAALEATGIATDEWFDVQLDLCLLGNMLAFAWEKALGGGNELSWWEDRAERGARRLASLGTT